MSNITLANNATELIKYGIITNIFRLLIISTMSFVR